MLRHILIRGNNNVADSTQMVQPLDSDSEFIIKLMIVNVRRTFCAVIIPDIPKALKYGNGLPWTTDPICMTLVSSFSLSHTFL